MTKVRFISYVKAETAKAAAVLELARRDLELHDRDALHRHLYEFITYKFLLSGTGCTEENILSLAKISTARILELTGGDVKAADISFGCTGTDTPVTKKIILLLALREYFDIFFDPSQSAEIETVGDLCDMLIKASFSKNI